MKEKDDKVKLAIVISNSVYESCDSLPACDYDHEYIKGILESSDEFKDILSIHNLDSLVAVDKIINFVETYKSNASIEQIFFYFSGHGYRSNDEFYFIFKNTNTDNLKSTSISNDEIDKYLKSLNPRVAIKVVDACQSGEQYIKDISTDTFFQKLNAKSSFEEVYFMYSSKSNQNSYASEEISFFTKMFLEAIYLQNSSQKIRYKFIADYISDEAERLLHKQQQPYFVSQGSNLAYLFENTEAVKNYLKAYFLKDSESLNESQNNKGSLIEIITKNSQLYCSEEEGHRNITNVFDHIRNYQFSEELIELFDIHNSSSKVILYNSKFIGEWLNNNTSNEILAKLTFNQLKETTKDYVKRPKKPSRREHDFLLSSIFGQDDYVLEDVEVIRQIISGVEYLTNHDEFFLNIRFEPKKEFQNLREYSSSFAVLFSKKDLYLFHNVEKLSIASWNHSNLPQCLNWVLNSFSLKKPNEETLDKIMLSIQQHIITDIKKSLDMEN